MRDRYGATMADWFIEVLSIPDARTPFPIRFIHMMQRFLENFEIALKSTTLGLPLMMVQKTWAAIRMSRGSKQHFASKFTVGFFSE